jgi:hypothetical protein
MERDLSLCRGSRDDPSGGSDQVLVLVSERVLAAFVLVKLVHHGRGEVPCHFPRNAVERAPSRP